MEKFNPLPTAEGGEGGGAQYESTSNTLLSFKTNTSIFKAYFKYISEFEDKYKSLESLDKYKSLIQVYFWVSK